MGEPDFLSSGRPKHRVASVIGWFKLVALVCAVAMGIATVGSSTAFADELQATEDIPDLAQTTTGEGNGISSTLSANASTLPVKATKTAMDGCGFAQAGTGTYASSICWIDFSNVTFNWQTSRTNSAACTGVRCYSKQNIVLNLPNGYSLAMDLTVSGDKVRPAAVPTWSGAAMGRTSYLGISGKPALYMERARSTVDTTTVEMDSITLSYNGKPATDLGYSLVIADAETTDPSESITWTSDVPIWLLSSKKEMDNSCGRSSDLEEGSRTWSCLPTDKQEPKNGFPILSADNPRSMTVKWDTNGQQGVALGVFMSTVQATGEYAANNGRYRATGADYLQTNIQYDGQPIPDGTSAMDGGSRGINKAGSVTAEYHLLNSRNAKVFKISAADLGGDSDFYTIRARCTNGSGIADCSGTVANGSGTIPKVRYYDEDGNAIPADGQGQPYSGSQYPSVAYAMLAPGAGDSLQVDFIYTPIVATLSFNKRMEGFDDSRRSFRFDLSKTSGGTVYNAAGSALSNTWRAVDVSGPNTPFTFPASGSFAFERGHTYQFQVTEHIDPQNQDASIDYDGRTITATVTVDPNGQVSIDYEGGEGEQSNTFVNKQKVQLVIRKEWEQAEGVDLTHTQPISLTVHVTCTEDVDQKACADFGTNGTQQLSLTADGEGVWQASADAVPAGIARTFTVTEDVPEYYHATYSFSGLTSRKNATVKVGATPTSAERTPTVTITNTPNVIDLSNIQVGKNVKGIDTSDDDFTFTLTPQKGEQILQDGNAFVSAQTIVSEKFTKDRPFHTAKFNGKVVVPNLQDVHFQVQEDTSNQKDFGWVYDDDTVGVTVSWNQDATPQFAYTYADDDPDRIYDNLAAFTNTWTAVSSLPTTGEDGMTPRTLLAGGSALGILAFLSATGVSIWRRHRRISL